MEKKKSSPHQLEEVAARKAQLKESLAPLEADATRGRWITDSNAMQFPELRRHEAFQRKAPRRLAKINTFFQMESAGVLELEKGEVSNRVTQNDILAAVNIKTKQKKFDLVLDKLGPYKIDFSSNGTHLALAGLRGHFATLNWKKFALTGETQLKDRCTDLKFCVDNSIVALAQRRFVYLYSKEGVEMHVLPKMANMSRLEYLQKHMLLCATSSTYSTMHYMDVSTGAEVSCKVPSVMRSPALCLRANPSNGVVSTCDGRGVVKHWSPTVVDPLIQIKAHKGPIFDIVYHHSGRFFLTLGGDHKLKLWDCRTMRTLEEFAVTYSFNCLDVSSSGLVAIGGGTNIQIWRGMFSGTKPSNVYLQHGLGYGNIAEQVKFCPFEDILGVGHSNGFSSVIIPGCGEANPDFYLANPHETERHRKDRVVVNLLDKLQPETITMDVQVTGVNEKRLEEYTANLLASRKARNIREKKQRRTDSSKGDQAPTGVVAVGTVDADEVDEELGYKERGATRTMKTKKELLKEKKMKRWDQKDTADKVRSKQVMRTSRKIQRLRHLKTIKAKEEGKKGKEKGEKNGKHEPASTELGHSDEPAKKARRTERSGGRTAVNAALRRLL